MPATVTLSQLKTRTLRRADMVSSSFVDTAASGELEGYIQEAGRELYDLILSAYGEDYYYSSSSTTTTANVATVSLPNDFYKLLAVDVAVPGASTLQQIERFNWNERNLYQSGTGWQIVGSLPRYRLRANTIWFLPTPTDAHAVTIHYVPTMSDINDTTTVFNGVNGWDEYIVLAAAIKCLAKEESDPSILMAELEKTRRRIVAMAPSRDIDKPMTVVDVCAPEGGAGDL